MPFRAVLVLLICSFILCTAHAELPHLSKMDANLASICRDGVLEGELSVIVQARDGRLANAKTEFAKLGGKVRSEFKSIRGFAGSIPAAKLADLGSLPSVSRLSSDAGVKKMLDSAVPSIGAPDAWRAGATGDGVSVAVIDSGVTVHGDFISRKHTAKAKRAISAGRWEEAMKAGAGSIIGGYDWVKEDDKWFKNDRCGHGTHVSGIISGTGLMTQLKRERKFYRHFTGVAPAADIVNCRVLDESGFGYVSDVISAIEWCVERKDKLDIGVINLSLGHPIAESHYTDPLCLATEYAWRKGIVVVVSAGNWGYKGYSTIFSPGNDPLVITVGAINTMGTDDIRDDEICGFSGRGPTAIDHVAKPDVVAPGNRIVAARRKKSRIEENYNCSNVLPLKDYMRHPRGDARKESEYFVLSGTSMAAAVVSGACALMLDQDPDITPDTVKTRLMLTAKRSKEYGPLWQGAGYISVIDALRCKITSADYAMSPVVLEADDGSYGIAPVPSFVQGDNLVWEPTPRPVPPPLGADAPPSGSSGGTLSGENLVWEPILSPPPPAEAYQPVLDLSWSGYGGSSWWPQWACGADTSLLPIYGEDFAIYFGEHGPKPRD